MSRVMFKRKAASHVFLVHFSPYHMLEDVSGSHTDEYTWLARSTVVSLWIMHKVVFCPVRMNLSAAIGQVMILQVAKT